MQLDMHATLTVAQHRVSININVMSSNVNVLSLLDLNPPIVLH